MRKEVMEHVSQNKDLQRFLREQPLWYRRLSRNPNDIQALEIAALHYYQRTIPHQVEKFTNSVQMASMMMSMFQAMKSQT
ncbi:YlbE-like family protein [Bacillus sp. JJ1532]|uniref:YlbE-like family protein n=1 Tax=unclassified Bacillus (in: firmicutes) TaxID=185979 RepID=UPI003000094C